MEKEMFYCSPCATKNKWPMYGTPSHGSCEICGEVTRCFNVPSSKLTTPKTTELATISHKLHVESGPEYQGETYIWCECQAGGLNLNQHYSSADFPDDVSLFEGSNVIMLMKFLNEHTPATEVIQVPVSTLHLECLFPMTPTPLASSDSCRHPATSVVVNHDGTYLYRCSTHVGLGDDGIFSGSIAHSISRVNQIVKINQIVTDD